MCCLHDGNCDATSQVSDVREQTKLSKELESMYPESAVAEALRNLRDKFGARARQLGRRQVETETELALPTGTGEERLDRGIEAKGRTGEGKP